MRRAVGLASVWLAIGACTGGSAFTTGSFSRSSGGSGIGRAPDDTGVGSSEGPPDDGIEIEVPFVACSVPSDAASDADVPDAATTDAGTTDAETLPAGTDAGLGDVQCSTPPPPDCVTPTTMVVFSAEGCDGERCVYIPSLIRCPGGCFRQVDGGKRCNE